MSAILGLGAKVVVEYKADTSDLKAKLKSLSGDEKKFAEEQLKHAEARNKALEGQKKGFELLATGIAASAAGVALAIKGLEAYGKTSDAAAKEVKNLKDTASQVFDTIGISIGKLVVQFQPLLSGIGDIVGLLGDVGAIGPAAIAALGYAISGNPKVAALLAAVGYAMQVKDKFGGVDPVDDELARGATQAGFVKNAKGYWIKASPEQLAATEAGRPRAVDLALGGTDETGLGGFSVERMNARIDNVIGGLVTRGLGVDSWQPLAWNKSKGGKGAAAPTSFGDNARIVGSDFDFEFGPTGPGGALADSVPRDEFGREVRFDTEGLLKDRIAGNKAAEDAAAAKRESKLAGIFGPLDEFNAYTMAFDTLSGAVGSAMTAWIDGSMSAGKAFKAFVGEAVKGIAIQMAMEALKHGAYAIGALAMGDAKGAALHGTSAAKFAAGAIVAAGAAKALGSSGASTGSGPGAPSVGGSGGGYQQQGNQTIIAYGDSFAEDSPRQRLLRAGRIVSRVSGTSGIEYA